MGKINSCTKGKVGEREVAALLRDNGYDARRGQQFAGGGDSPDVVHDMDRVHIEVKRVEALQLYKALEQADRDKKDEDRPIVFHRKNGKRWVVIMYADDFLTISRGNI